MNDGTVRTNTRTNSVLYITAFSHQLFLHARACLVSWLHDGAPALVLAAGGICFGGFALGRSFHFGLFDFRVRLGLGLCVRFRFGLAFLARRIRDGLFKGALGRLRLGLDSNGLFALLPLDLSCLCCGGGCSLGCPGCLGRLPVSVWARGRCGAANAVGRLAAAATQRRSER